MGEAAKGWIVKLYRKEGNSEAENQPHVDRISDDSQALTSRVCGM
jgi:hypothetical protein